MSWTISPGTSSTRFYHFKKNSFTLQDSSIPGITFVARARPSISAGPAARICTHYTTQFFLNIVIKIYIRKNNKPNLDVVTPSRYKSGDQLRTPGTLFTRMLTVWDSWPVDCFIKISNLSYTR